MYFIRVFFVFLAFFALEAKACDDCSEDFTGETSSGGGCLCPSPSFLEVWGPPILTSTMSLIISPCILPSIKYCKESECLPCRKLGRGIQGKLCPRAKKDGLDDRTSKGMSALDAGLSELSTEEGSD